MNLKMPLILSLFVFLQIVPNPSHAESGKSLNGRPNSEGNGKNEAGKVAMTTREEMLLFFEEKDLIVTATKHVQTLQEAPAIATVITADEIKRMGARNLANILKRVPGFGVTRGFFGLDQIELRGMKTDYSEKIKLLIDGHSLNSSENGGPSWGYDRMPLDNIKRIEIIRGPGSALYGSNAFVGVINIITKDGKDIDGTIVSGGAGSYDTWNVNMQTGKRTDNDVDVALSIDYSETIGPKLKIERDSQGNSGYTDDREKKFDAQLKAKYKDLSFNSKYIVRRKGPFIGVINAVNEKSDVDILQFFGDLTYKRSLHEKLDLTVRGYMDEFDWNAYWQLLPEKLYPVPGGMLGNPSLRERNIGSELQLDFKPTEQHVLTLGAMYENRQVYDVNVKANFCSDTTSSACIFGSPLGSFQDISNRWNWLDEKTRYVKALYLQDVWTPTEDLGITAGVRYDEYSDFGGTTNPKAAAVWKFLPRWDMKLMYGEAFRAPSNGELDLKNNPAQLGNPSLKPEKIKTYEVSLGHEIERHASYRVSYFNSFFSDKIQQTGTPLKYDNKGGAKVDGIEAEIRWYFTGDSNTYINGNFTYLRPEDKETGRDLPEIAKNRGNVELNTAMNRYVNFNTNILMVGERPRAVGDTRNPLPAYAVADLALSLKNLYRGLELRGTVNNLLNQKYEDPSIITVPQQVSDIPKEGTSYFIKAEYKF